MCVFELSVTLCACNDRRCKLKVTELGENEDTYQGHIVKVSTCLRKGPTCMGMFTNTDPDRPLVRLGLMDPNNGNSKQDCKNAVHVYQEENAPKVCADVCKACLLVCDWEGCPSIPSTSGKGDEKPEGKEEPKGDDEPKIPT